MVREKLVLELSYLGTAYVGWQPQPAPRPAADADAGPGPCKNFNRGRCKKGAGCRSAHICTRCHRAGLRLPHTAQDPSCDSLAAVGSVQEVIDAAVAGAYAECQIFQRITKAPPSGCVSSGRTDRGVHARQMLGYCNVQLTQSMDAIGVAALDAVAAEFPALVSARLPWDVRCHSAAWSTDALFWARGNARKTYTYYLLEGDGTSGPVNTTGIAGNLASASWRLAEGPPLDLRLMREAANYIEGIHDFIAYSSVVASGAKDTVRHVASVEFATPEHVHFDILELCFFRGAVWATASCPLCTGVCEADVVRGLRLIQVSVCGYGFLKHMVRRIVGQLVEVGRGVEGPNSAEMLLGTPEPVKAPKAPACGLWLARVEPLVDEPSECALRTEAVESSELVAEQVD